MKILKENHGFTLVEILAAMAILAILMGIGVGAYTRYRKKAIENNYEIIQKNALSAAENYFMDNINATSVDLDKLVEESYLEKVMDPAHKTETCTGTIKMLEDTKPDNPETIQSNKYKIDLTCGKEKRCMVSNSKLGCDSEGGITTDGKTTVFDSGFIETAKNPINMESATFQNGISLVIRVKFNELKKSTMDYFGNWQSGGGGLYLYYSTHCFSFEEYILNKGYIKVKTNTPAIKNKWYIVVGTYDNNSFKIYVNGEKLGEKEEPGKIQASSLSFMIGANPEKNGNSDGGHTYYTALSTSNALIFNRGLTDSEIKQYYSNPDIAISYTGDAIYSKSF